MKNKKITKLFIIPLMLFVFSFSTMTAFANTYQGDQAEEIITVISDQPEVTTTYIYQNNDKISRVIVPGIFQHTASWTGTNTFELISKNIGGGQITNIVYSVSVYDKEGKLIGTSSRSQPNVGAYGSTQASWTYAFAHKVSFTVFSTVDGVNYSATGSLSK